MKVGTLYIKRVVNGEIKNFPSDDNVATIGTYTNERKRMGGAPTITATLYYPTPLDKEWTYDEYVEFDGDRYYITSIPSSSKDNSTGQYKHELTFTSHRELLDNTLFFDVVTSDTATQMTDKYRSNQTKFTFGGDIYEFVARVNSSMSYCGLYNPNGKTEAEKGYYLVVDEGYGTDEVKEISFENQYLTNVLQLINTEYELDYYWVGNVCHVGKVQYDLTEHILEYGRDKELLSIGKENANTKLVDMITGYGSTDNIPYYYPNNDEYGIAIFNSTNIDNPLVDISLAKLQKAFGADYTGKYTLVKRMSRKAVISNDRFPFRFMLNPTQFAPSTKPYTFSYSFEIAINCEVGTVIKEPSINITYITADGINVFSQSEKLDFHLRTKSEEFKNIYFNGRYECLTSDIYIFTFVDLINVYNETDKTIPFEKGIIDAQAGGYIELDYSNHKEDYYWVKDNDKVADYSASGITLNTDEAQKTAAINDFSFYNDGEIDSELTTFKIPYYTYSEGFVEGSDTSAIKIDITGRKWIDPVSNLMPSVYRSSNGAERFYYAKDDTYKIPDTDNYYTFKNLYKQGFPHQGSVSYDDIKPTINGVKNSKGELFGEITDVAFDSNDSDVKGSDGETFLHQYFYIKLHIFDGEFGFNLFKQALASDNAKINMIDCQGCPACVFPIESYWDSGKNNCYNILNTDGNGNLVATGKLDTENGYKGDYIFLDNNESISDTKNQNTQEKEIWIAVQKETSTLGIVMPNAAAGFKPKKGDKFVITGIQMPPSLVYAAEKRLDDALIKYMSENNEDQFNYSIKFSRVYLAENPDFASKLNENSKLAIRYNGNTEPKEVFVSNYTVKVESNALASIEVELTNSLEVAASDIKQIIDSVKGETVRSLTSLVSGSENSFNANIADKLYLSKRTDDTAYGLISFLKGISLGTNYSISELGDAFLRVIQGKGYYISEDGDVVFREIASSDYDYAAQSGYGMKRREDGKFKLSLTDLEVWGKAVFHELEIRKLSYVGGNFIFSPAGSTLMHVEEIKTSVLQGQASIITGYKCYFLADDGTTATENMWKVGDLAFSQSFGIKEGVYENVGNRRYWRKVTAVSSESEQITDADGNILYDGRKFGWITLSNTMAGTSYDKNSDAPRAGDAVCCLGNVSDGERQNAIEIQTVGDLAPAIIQYGGIKTFSLTNCVKTQISPKGNKFIGDFSTTTGTDIGGAITDINSNLSDTNGRITNLNDYTTNAVKKIEGEIDEVRTAAEDAGADAQDALEGVTQVKGSVTTLQTDVNGIKGTVAKLSERVDGNDTQIGALETSVSEIKQTADSISMKVDQQSVRGRNLIPRSYFFNTSRIYGIGQRKFTLEAGKYYSLSVNGHIDAALKNGGGVLRAFIFNSAWTFQKYLDIDSTTDITATLEGNSSFTVESTGEYYFQAYPFHPTGKFKDTKPQEDGLITLNWAQLEEGSVCSPWSLHESDPAISGNFLPTLSDDKWSRVGDIQEGALDTGFRKLQALHYKNTSSSEVDVLYMNNVFAPDSGEVYTLSFWVKGSGTFKSFLYPEACERVADNFGQVGTQEDGYLPHTLTSDWQRIRIAYCTKQLFGNYFYNAGFNAASGYTSNWDVTGSTRHIASAADGWGGQYISKSSGASYCEISQAVGASLWASWWTVTFKSKNPSAMRIYLSGIYLDTIDNSGMTVCVDGVDQSVKSDSGVLYVEVDASATAYTEHSITFKASSALSSARIYFRTYGSYFYIAKPMLTPAPQKSGFSTREQGTVRCILPCRLEAGSEVWIGGVKLEQGGRMTDYTEDGVSVDELLATGIDIRSRKITATADTFEVRNNQGTTTAKVNADGVFETNDIVCNGGTFKNIKSTDMTAEGGTFTNITAESGTYKNIQVTENSWISNGKFCGEKQSDGTILGGFSVGSQGLTYDIPQGWLGSSKGAASNITIQGADGSLSSKIGVIFDNNYLMGAELKVKYSKNDTPWGSYNVAAWLEASGNPQGQNYAFMGTGHGILRGMIEGTSFALISSSKLEIGTVDLQFYGNRWLFDCPLGVVNVYLPARGGVATFLGNSGAWSLRIMVICSPTSSNSVKISGRQSSGTWASTEEPILYNKSGSQVSSITVNKGQIMEILLVWDGTNYYAMHIKDNG